MTKKQPPSKPFLQNRRYRYPIRAIDTRELRQRFLIVCQGTKTEPNYFNQFRVPKLVLVVKGVGCDPYTLVCQALKDRDNDDYDQVWCVFDRDDTAKERFNKALALADKENIQVAYSNQAFELWYLLHFQYLNSAQTRQDYIHSLERHLARQYDKTDDTLFDYLLSRQGDAIRNAERLLAQYQPLKPVEDDPSTTVHLLVVQLNRFHL